LSEFGLPTEPSQANFVLATVPAGARLDAGSLYEALKAQNILVRYFPMPRLDDKLRISVGSPSENDALLTAIGGLLG
jgi:histidinol-phosphate aminotransferase